MAKWEEKTTRRFANFRIEATKTFTWNWMFGLFVNCDLCSSLVLLLWRLTHTHDLKASTNVSGGKLQLTCRNTHSDAVNLHVSSTESDIFGYIENSLTSISKHLSRICCWPRFSLIGHPKNRMDSKSNQQQLHLVKIRELRSLWTFVWLSIQPFRT